MAADGRTPACPLASSLRVRLVEIPEYQGVPGTQGGRTTTPPVGVRHLIMSLPARDLRLST